MMIAERTAGFDRAEIVRLFEQIGTLLQRPSRICIIGGAAGILAGQDRIADDIDVFWPRCSIDPNDLARVGRAIGLRVVVHEDDVAPGYLQLVQPGIVNVPKEADEEFIGKWGRLEVVMPAPEAIVAMKMLRGEERDIADAVWWSAERHLERSDIMREISGLPRRDVEQAKENMVLLDVLSLDRYPQPRMVA